MINRRRVTTIHIAALMALMSTTGLVEAQNQRSMLKGKIDSTRQTALPGNVRSAALDPANDRGAVDGSLAMEHVLLQLQRSPESEAALKKYIDGLNDESSPNFHKWLTAEELGAQYGPAAADLTAVTDWLGGQGFTVNQVYPTGMVVDISGTAAQVDATFHTNLHKLSVDGEAHVANTANPQIPTALVGIIAGVVSLNDFRPHAMHQKFSPAHFGAHSGSLIAAASPAATEAQAASSGAQPNYTVSADTQLVVPGDLATIYSLDKLFAAGYSGQGQEITIIEDTDLYSTDDWGAFRTAFGLTAYRAGRLLQEHPGTGCKDPGVNLDDDEAILDAEWATAAAPSSTVVLASCSDTKATFGGLLALENLLIKKNPPQVVSISYGEAESENGAASNAAYNAAYEVAAAEGVSVFVSSGDSGAAVADDHRAKAKNGIQVSGFASTPYNVAVGGTDFGDTITGTNSLYWNASNNATYASAKSYILEIPWNDSCASFLVDYALGYSTAYGKDGACNSATGKEYFLTTAAGSGGPSGCATGSPEITGTQASCAGYPKPSWQSLVGVPADGVRDLPDVSLFASNGIWGHYYAFCYTDPAGGGVPCTGAPDTWNGGGGTSFAAPIMAAIQSLVNQKTKSVWGNPNPTYYKLAAAEYGSAGNSTCNSSNGNAVGSGCIFHDVTLGDMDVPCKGPLNCYTPSGANGVLSVSDTEFVPAYGTTTGWDFATGIGSVNAYNLVTKWNSVTH